MPPNQPARPGPGDPPAASLGELGEFGLIAQITQGITAGGPILVGPGDDAAVFTVQGPAACSTDTLIEGVHFRRDWSLAHEVGSKAVAVNVADLEAMGARPVALVVGFSAPPDLPVSWARQCYQGMAAEAAKCEIALVGGDVTAARDITIAVTVIGDFGTRAPVLRSGARPGQVVAMVGRVGWAAAGLVVLGRGFRSPRAVVEAQKVPQVPYGEGIRAAGAGATAMIDVSDGLLADAGHIAEESGVTIDIDSSVFTVPDPLQAVAAATGKDALTLMLTGGEDHALLATFDPQVALPTGWVRIGTVGERAGTEGDLVLVDGKTWEGENGYDHYRH